MALDNLFVNEPELPQMQRTKVPEDPLLWSETITAYLKERFPELAALAIEIEIRTKDDASGTAVGAAKVISDEAQKSLFVPFVIKRFELCPLDIWMEPETQKVHPLTRDTFNKEFFLSQSARELDARPADAAGQYFNDPSMWTQTYPPLQGRYSYASGGFWLLEALAESMTKEDLESFRHVLEADPAIVAQFQKAGSSVYDAIKAISTHKKTAAVNANNWAQSAMKLLPVGAAHIKKEHPDKYSILSAAEDTFDLSQSIPMGREECKRFLEKITPHAEDVLHDVDQEGEKMLVIGKPMPGVFLYEDMTAKPELATEFSGFHVKNKNGIGIEGVVIPNVVKLNGSKAAGKLFLSDNHASYQANIAGTKMKDSAIIKTVLKPCAVRTGQTGTFVFVDDGKAVATEPLVIKTVDKSFEERVVALTLDGKKVSIKFTYGDPAYMASPTPAKKAKNFLDVHGMIEVRPQEYLLPKRMMWIPMQGFTDVTSSAGDYMAKEAHAHMTPNPLVIRYTGTQYDFRGAGLEGAHELNEKQASVALAALGVPADKASKALKRAKLAFRAEIHGTRKLRKKSDIIKEAHAAYADVEKLAKQLRCNLVKEASVIAANADLLKKKAEAPDNSATVDVLLGLNFLNADNMAKFVSYKPVMERCADYLAELTLASRLGMKDVAESAAVSAMAKLIEVIDGIKRLEAAIRPVVAKTAAPAMANARRWVGVRPSALKALGSKPAGTSAALTGVAKPLGKTSAAALPAEQVDPFAMGMIDGEMDSHLYLERFKSNPQDMLKYMNGKRLAESNKAQATALTKAQTEPLKPQQPQPAAAAKPAAKPAGGATKKANALTIKSAGLSSAAKRCGAVMANLAKPKKK